MSPWITVGGYTAAAVMTLLWLDARDEAIEIRAGCNTEHVQAALDAERITSAAQASAYEERIAQLDAQKELETEARKIAQDAELDAVATTAARDQKINQLMLEASIDDIPDSQECLNVFTLEPSIDRLLHAEDSRAGGGGAGTGDDPDGSGAQGADETDTPGGNFANITYGDALILWGQDRDIIQTLNGQLAAIEALGHELPD